MAKKTPEYVDGFVLAVPKKNIEAYRELAEKSAQVFLKHGALEVRECMAEDVKKGELTSFPQSVLLKKNEVVFFSWITYKSRAHRDQVNKKMMNDPEMNAMMEGKGMPFDMQRMIYGGFTTVVKAQK
jgi:uncharacterized protein YbaA (DUF1428 family)